MAGAPKIIGVVTEWSSAIVVEGCRAGAAITIEMTAPGAAKVIAAKGTSGGGRDTLPLQVQRLKAGASLRADNWDASQPSVTVMPAPITNSDLPAMAFATALYQCGVFVELQGGFPGAEAHLVIDDAGKSQEIGTGRVGPDGTILITLTEQPAAGTEVIAEQGPPAGFPALPAAPAAAAVVITIQTLTAGPLPKLTVPGLSLNGRYPGCASVLPVKGAVPGAFIRGTFSSGRTATWPAALTSENLALTPPGTAEGLSIEQEFRNCDRHAPSPPTQINFGQPLPPPAMSIGPVCVGMTEVRLSNLKPGANLTLALAGGQVLDYTVPPDVTVWDAPVPSLPDGVLTAIEEACGLKSQTAVDVAGSTGSNLLYVASPVYRCGRSVAVHTGQSGVLACGSKTTTRGTVQRSASVVGGPGRVVLDVFPALGPDDGELWAERLGCGGRVTQSQPVPVLPNRGSLKEASVSPFPVGGDTSIEVIGGQPNATAFIVAQAAGQAEATMGSQELLADSDVVALT
ncbi:MAG: hypothetical protein ACLPZR_13475 [Solirubrobacteraceae bacterium]